MQVIIYLTMQIIQDTSSSTKVRVVFDASMKTSSEISLNEILIVGPNVQQPDLFSTIIRFRLRKYTFVADIDQMYHQIKIIPSHSSFQRIFSRENVDELIGVYELSTVTFGTSAAPYLATCCLKKLGEELQDQNVILKSVLLMIFMLIMCCQDQALLSLRFNFKNNLLKCCKGQVLSSVNGVQTRQSFCICYPH